MINRKLIYLLALLLSFSAGGSIFAQEPETDKISQEAAKFEAELGKFKDTSPEAADILVKLVDVYHADARAFGLIRAGQKFTAAHPTDARHKAVMLKLIDGLEAMSRNKDLVVAVRQFLTRYPEAPECAQLEPRLAGALNELNDLPRAADAYRAIWQRQGATEAGRDAGVQAMTRYSAIGSAPSISTAAELGEEMVDKLPAGDFTKFVGLQSVAEWRRIQQWAKSNLAGAKLLKKGVTMEPEVLRELHRTMAENHMNLGQRMNAVESLKAARAIRDDWYTHYYLIENLFTGAAKAAELEPLVNEYLAKYPERADRFSRQSHLAHAYLRDGDKPRALQLIGALLPFDALTNGSASILVTNLGVEPAQVAEAERLLKEALTKNKDHAWYLRYVLAFEVYRDRVKDPAKVRQTLLEFVTLSPTDDGNANAAVDWLLTNAPTEADFKADAAKLLAARREFVHLANFRNALPNWQKTAAANKDLKAKADFLKAELDKQNADPILKLWSKFQGVTIGADEAPRLELLKPENLAKQTEAQLNLLHSNQSYYLRHYSPSDRRAASALAYGAYSKAFPKDYAIATLFLTTATDYGPVPLMKEAAEKLLTFEPQSNEVDLWRRLMIAADQNNDPDLVKRAFNWIVKSQEKFGQDPAYAATIGDTLVKHKFDAEAQAYWISAVKLNRNYSESRECALRLLPKVPPANKIAFVKELFSHPTDFLGRYAQWLAADYFAAADVNNFVAVLAEARKRQLERPFRYLDVEPAVLNTWVDATRASATLTEPDKLRIYTAIRDLQAYYPSAGAELGILELTPPDPKQPINRLLAYQRATRMLGNEAYDWDRLAVFAQAALAKKDYVTTATLVTGMLANITNAGPDRFKAGRDMVAQSYARMGAVGLTIDESSPLAPLLQAALYLRLGDERLAYDTFVANKDLFDQNRNEAPVDVLIFVCERLLGAGGDENHEYVEATLRGWLVKHSESPQHEAVTKAQIQLLLAKNYFKAQRYDVSRTEYTTVINRYPGTKEATEAEFGIGETFLSQKVYDQAEQVFEKLATSKDLAVVVRAEFLRGVLAFRRGDHDDARDIFRGVLERVPSVELANQALYNLSEVYGAEERYLDQLNMLRTVGRLGGASKRRHAPGQPLSIVVHDGDLGISRGHNRIPVIVTTEPGGDKETVYLTSAGAGKGLFRVDLDTRLGNASPGDKVLQLTGKDIIKCDYPAEFKAEFKTVPLSDVEIRVASNAKFEVSSSKVIDAKEETFSERLEREAREETEGDKRVSQGRPSTQIKPGNLIYLRVQDADRDLTDAADKIVVKLTANSGDQVQATITETGPHTGIFEGTVQTGELPAGALASDAAIDHSALMAIDRDPNTYWSSLPDGATPKSLTVDMKDLRNVARVKLTSPQAGQNSPVRGTLLGSYDGRFWYRLASNPGPLAAIPVGEFGAMHRRVYEGNYTGIADWKAIADLAKNAKPANEADTNEVNWARPEEDPKEKVGKLYAVIWHGKLVQPRDGAARISVAGTRTALSLDGRVELAPGVGNRTVDVWLEAGTHDLTIFSASGTGEETVAATWARADLNVEQVTLLPFRPSDFDLDQPVAKRKRVEATPATAVVAENAWEFRFKPADLRYVRFVCDEYVGEALHISQVEVGGRLPNQIFIPTETDVLSLAANEVLEIAGGDVVSATYTDEFISSDFSSSQLLEHKLTATYYNAAVQSIAYDLERNNDGAVLRQRKELLRVDPGERVVIEIIDYDEDRTDGRDTVKFQVMVNEGDPVELVATETDDFTGIFTKEIDTSPKTAEGKFTVKQGDRIYVRYFDTQNTFPGHSVPRETVVFVNEPSAAQVRVYESRIERGPAESKAPPRTVYLPPPDGKPASGVALEAPLTVEVIDPDAAKDSRSSVVVSLTTTDGAKVQVRCVVSGAFDELSAAPGVPNELLNKTALEEGRFVGQVILQLGGKNSAGEVPLTSEMPRQLVGGPVMENESGSKPVGESLITRVLNVTGKDIITGVYKDERHPADSPDSLSSKARLIVNGMLAITDREYEKVVDRLHVGEKLFLRVLDADRDSTDERDSVNVEVVTDAGEKETVELVETLAHSGIFTGSLVLKANDKPTAGNLKPEDAAIEVYFGHVLTATYVDKLAGTESGELTLTSEAPIVIGTNGLVLAFTKTFNDETLAVETKFHMAESFFELFKSHKGLGRDEDQKGDLEAGRRILREVMEDYPDPKYAPRVAYLLGQFAQELGQWDEAVASYELIIRQFPDHTLAADAQYKLAQSHEESGDFDKALEAYVTLAATYPKSPLIASVMIRISDHFYKKETYDVAAQVGEKFLERFQGNPNAPRMAFRIGQCYYKAKKYKEAADSFDRFAKIFPDDKLASQALFWSGESFRMGSNNPLAFQRYNRCRWDFPSSEAAKYARGRLALPEMLQQFESAANDLDQ